MLGLTGLLLLRALHIVVGACWVGAVVFIALFLLPSVRAVGAAGGPVMQQLTQIRRLPGWLTGLMIVGLASGMALYWHDSVGFTSSWLASGPVRIYGAGGVLALLASALGVTVNTPAARRLRALMADAQAAGRAPTPEELAQVRRLQARLGSGLAVGALLLVLATVAMAVARYVP